MTARAGCYVRDNGRPGPCGLHLDEHRLSDDKTAWLHPVGLNARGYWTWDEDASITNETSDA